MAVQSLLLEHASSIDTRLSSLLPPADRSPEKLHEAMRYACLAPGKRLRPALCMESARACGAEVSEVLDAGCAIEMVHCFSLIHDDLPALDNDELRRGRPTVHIQFGEAVAILAGDALFALAFDTLARLKADPVRILSSVRILTVATGSDGLVGGETLDILCEGMPADADTLAMIHSLKTGALISASCEIGAELAGADHQTVKNLREYGRLVGLAFQIADDVLNETATPEQLGKAAGSDRERKKMTYPALYGIEGARNSAKRAIEESLNCLEGLPADTKFLQELAQFSIHRLN